MLELVTQNRPNFGLFLRIKNLGQRLAHFSRSVALTCNIKYATPFDSNLV